MSIVWIMIVGLALANFIFHFGDLCEWSDGMTERQHQQRLEKMRRRADKQLAEQVMVCALSDALTVYYNNKIRPKEGVYR